MASLLKFFSSKLGKKSRESRYGKSRTVASVSISHAQPSAELDSSRDPSGALVQLQARYEQLERSCRRLSKAYAVLYKENESLKASQVELRMENHMLWKAYGGDVKLEECTTRVPSGTDKDVDELRDLLRRASVIVSDWQVDSRARISQRVAVNDEYDDAPAVGDIQSLASEESFQLVDSDDECPADDE